MHKLKFIFFALLFVFGTSQAESNSCTAQDTKKILSAVQCYLSTKTAIHPNDAIISQGKCAGNYARVNVHPKKPVTDDALVYLEKRHDSWQILQFGTSFDPEFLNTLPKELR